MAVLEKIRQRNIFLTIIIGLALVLFIITLAGNTGQEMWRQIQNFTGGNSAIKVGGKSIDAQEFAQELERFNKMNENAGQQDAAAMRAQFTQYKEQELLAEAECEDLGIEASKEELSYYTVGDQPTQYIQAVAQKLGAAPKDIYEAMKSPDKKMEQDPNFLAIKDEWDYAVEMTEKQIKMQKMGMLATHLIQPNAIELAQLEEETGSEYDVELASKSYDDIPDDGFKVSDKEIKDAYETYKSLYKINEEQRRIHYIVLDIAPSAADLQAADKQMNMLLSKLGSTSGMQAALEFSGVTQDSITITSKEANDTTLKQVIAGEVGNVKLVPRTNNNYTFYKLLGSYTMADSLKIQVVQIAADKATQGKALADLKAGSKPAEVSKKYNKNIQAEQAVSENTIRPMQLDDKMRAKVAAANGDEWFMLNQQDQGCVIAQITDRKAETVFYKLGRALYTCDPSTDTENSLRDKLQRYVGTNKTMKAFTNEKNAKKAGLQLQETVVTASSAQISNGAGYMGMSMGLSDSYSAIKWAFENKVGDISPILDIDKGNKIIAVCLDEVYDKDYMPVTTPKVKEELKRIVLNEKKGAKLLKDWEGKATSVKDYADKMKAQFNDSLHVSFAAAGQIEPGLLGAIVGAANKGQLNKLQKLYKGKGGVYAFIVKAKRPGERKLPTEQLKAQYAQVCGMNLGEAFMNSRKIKNNTIKFYQ